jgi:hypothetical protein
MPHIESFDFVYSRKRAAPYLSIAYNVIDVQYIFAVFLDQVNN